MTRFHLNIRRGCLALWSGRLIRQLFVQKEAGNELTVNGQRFRDIIILFFVLQIKNIELEDMSFRQGSATCDTARETFAVLHESVPSHV